MELQPDQDRTDAFWQRYRKALAEQGLRGKAVDWSVKRVENFIRSAGGLRLKEQTAEELRAYLCRQALDRRLQDWQYEQMVEALEYFEEVGRHIHASGGRQVFADMLKGRRVADQYGGELECLRQAIRARHYSIRTEQSYQQWLMRFITFHGYRAPMESGAKEVKAYLTCLADVRRVSASTQRQALNALAFFYKQVLGQPFGELGQFPLALGSLATITTASHSSQGKRGDLRLMECLLNTERLGPLCFPGDFREFCSQVVRDSYRNGFAHTLPPIC